MIGSDYDKEDLSDGNNKGFRITMRPSIQNVFKLGAPRSTMHGVPGLSGDNDEISE